MGVRLRRAPWLRCAWTCASKSLRGRPSWPRAIAWCCLLVTPATRPSGHRDEVERAMPPGTPSRPSSTPTTSGCTMAAGIALSGSTQWASASDCNRASLCLGCTTSLGRRSSATKHQPAAPQPPAQYRRRRHRRSRQSRQSRTGQRWGQSKPHHQQKPKLPLRQHRYRRLLRLRLLRPATNPR